MDTYWTLVTAGVEKSLGDWGVSIDFTVSRQNKGKATANLHTTESFDLGATQWPFKQAATIWRARTLSGGVYSGGSIYFKGFFDDPTRETSGGRENVHYHLHNVWWLFERNAFKQYRMQFTGWDATHQRIIQVTVEDGGSGYAVGDALSPTGGSGTAATLAVAAVNAGAVTLVVITNGGGAYTANPATPNAATTSGSGSGVSLGFVFGKAPTLTKQVISEVFLGEDLHAAGGYTSVWPNGNGDQIGEVIDWMNETYNPTRRGATSGIDASQDVVQKGTIDPHAIMPVTRYNTIFCDEAIKVCLRWDADTVIVEDPTTAPPTLSVRKLAKWNYATTPPTFIDYTNLTEVTIDITAEQQRGISIQSQLGRNLPGVMIYYKWITELDRLFIPQAVVDKYPAGVTDFTPEVMSHTIDLQGTKLMHVQAKVKVSPISQLTDGVAAHAKAWWLAHDATLGESNVSGSTITVGATTILDDNGGTINTTDYPNELLGTDLPEWTGTKAVRATIRSEISFQRYADSSHTVLDESTNKRIHTQRVILTDAITNLYSTISFFQAAESIPQNVAESVYRSAAGTQYAGKITFTAAQLRSDITMGNRVKLVGPTTTFSNCLVQEIETRPAFGETTVTFGAYPLVDLDMWIELARATRERHIFELPSGRGDGGTSGIGGQTVDTGGNAPGDNTSHGAGGKSYSSVIAPE